MWRFIYNWSSPKLFYHKAQQWLPWLILFTVLLLGIGLFDGLLLAPPDYQQGDGFRIMYIHVPCAFMSLGIYTFMTITALIGMVWRIKLAHILMRAAAPIGAWLTFLALVTGSLWGKPMWGTYWVWDARLTSELILLFLYLGFIGLQSAITDQQVAARAGSILLFVGFIDIPIIHFSVVWWNSIHQGASLSLLSKPTIAPSMLWPLLIMLVAFGFLFTTLLFMRGRTEVLRWEAKKQWVSEL